ncbi:MAG: protein translocase subunit SecF [Clostridiaceae bacterium]|nr:protein translocase subunit SecF [Clostridiaceae bacterium]
MDIMAKKKIFFGISIAVILVGIVSMLIFGLNEDIDFAGGTEMHVRIGKAFNNEDIRSITTDVIGFEPSSIQKTGDGFEVIIKMKDISSAKRDELFKAIKEKYGLEDSALLTADTVSPTVGSELRYNAFLSALIASVLMLVYISFRFELKSGVAAVIALIHDVLVMMSVYAIFRIPINTSFIAAILTILGYSINDTIIIFDRIRENKKYMRKEKFSEIANKSIWQSMPRSVNTALTTLLTITMLYILGVRSIKEFAFPIIIGLISGTYSSIFLASPIWVIWQEWEDKKKSRVKTA